MPVADGASDVTVSQSAPIPVQKYRDASEPVREMFQQPDAVKAYARVRGLGSQYLYLGPAERHYQHSRVGRAVDVATNIPRPCDQPSRQRNICLSRGNAASAVQTSSPNDRMEKKTSTIFLNLKLNRR